MTRRDYYDGRLGQGSGLGCSETAVGEALDGWSVGAEKLAAPPDAADALFVRGAEPVLPENHSNHAWWLQREWVGAEEAENIGVVFEQAFLGERYDGGVVPRGERG